MIHYQSPTSVLEQHIPLDVLQSQLFILRLLSACMQHHWKSYKEISKQRLAEGATVALSAEAEAAAAATGAIGSESEFLQTPIVTTTTTTTTTTSSSSSPINNTKTRRRRSAKQEEEEEEDEPDVDRHSPDDALHSSKMIDPPPLDEALVTFILTLVGRFLNQTHLIEETSDRHTSTPSDYDTLLVANSSEMNLDHKTLEMVMEIYRTAGRVLYYVSASNWSTYYAKIKNAVHILGAMGGDGSEMNPPEIRLLEFSCLTRQRLHTVLSGKF